MLYEVITSALTVIALRRLSPQLAISVEGLLRELRIDVSPHDA